MRLLIRLFQFFAVVCINKIFSTLDFEKKLDFELQIKNFQISNFK